MTRADLRFAHISDLHFLDGRVVSEPRLPALPVYVR